MIIRIRSYQADLFSHAVCCPEVFGDLSFVVTDHFIGHIQDALAAAVILFQLYHFYIIVIFLELEDIFNGGAAEAVNTLCIVSHHADIFMRGSQ